MTRSTALSRVDGRRFDALRPIQIELGLQKNPEGSVLYRCGGTAVLVSVSIENGVKDWLKGQGKGWITAEYAMHPRANRGRQRREGWGSPIGGRTHEIQRLVGRALRAAIRPERIGERTITVDCDVLDADGGTRTASITGGYVALVVALDKLRRQGLLDRGVLRGPIAAISVGWLDGSPMLDLSYVEDSRAEVDLNVVATATGAIIEVQGTAEQAPIDKAHFDAMLDTGLAALPDLVAAQNLALEAAGIDATKLMA